MDFFNKQNTTLFVIYTMFFVALKGFVLWRASKNNNKIVFVAVLFLNTLGIMEVVYLILDRFKFNPKPVKKLKNGTKEK